MNRRGFLQGVFGGVAATGLIIAAKPSDIEAFASPLTKGAPLIIDQLPVKATGIGEHLYNSRGEVVAMVRSINMHRPTTDVTSAFDTSVQYVQGMPEIEITAISIGPLQLEWDSKDRMPMLRGRK